MIVIRPKGRLGNLMFQYMLARHIERRIGRSLPIVGHSIPEWSLSGSEICDLNGRFAILRVHNFNLDHIIYLYETKTIDYIVIEGWGMRLEYYKEIEFYRSLFDSNKVLLNSTSDSEILINIRAEDILSGWHPEYYPAPFCFYEKVIQETGLHPVFMGQLDDHPYIDALRKRFPNARFIGKQDSMHDFELIRQSKHHILSISSFSWIAAWLSKKAETIHMPARGMYDPRNPQSNLLPISDSRYRFYDYNFPSVDRRKNSDLVTWASQETRCDAVPVDQLKELIHRTIMSLAHPSSANEMLGPDVWMNNHIQHFWNQTVGEPFPA